MVRLTQGFAAPSASDARELAPLRCLGPNRSSAVATSRNGGRGCTRGEPSDRPQRGANSGLSSGSRRILKAGSAT